MEDEKIKSLLSIIESLDNKSSLDEVVKSFEIVVEFAKQTREMTEEELKNLRSMFVEARDELKTSSSERFESLKARLIAQVTEKLSTVKDGKDGKNGKDGRDGIDGKDGKDLQPETAIETANRLNTKQEIIEQKTIKGLVDRLEDLEQKIKKAKGTTNIIGGATGGGHTAKVHDLSDSLDGVTKTFPLPAFWRVLNVYSTSTPVIFRPTVDYTVDGSAMTITFTDQISESTTLSAGQTLLVLYSE